MLQENKHFLRGPQTFHFIAFNAVSSAHSLPKLKRAVLGLLYEFQKMR